MQALFTQFFDYTQQRINQLDKQAQQILQDDDKSSFDDVLTIAQQMVAIGEYQEAYQQILAFTERYPFVFFDRVGLALAKPITTALGLDELALQRLRKIRSLGYRANSWRLKDAEAMAKAYPYTYYKPSFNITQHLAVGNLVKLDFTFDSENAEDSQITKDQIVDSTITQSQIPEGERMWVKIKYIDKDKASFIGELVNTPLWLLDLHYGDEITFSHKHIIDHDMPRYEDNLVDKYVPRCMVNRAIIYDNAPINYLRHDVPLPQSEEDKFNSPDSGWSIYTGDESREYLDNDDNFVMVSLGAVLRRDDSILEYLEWGVGHAFVRDETGHFVAVDFGVD